MLFLYVPRHARWRDGFFYRQETVAFSEVELSGVQTWNQAWLKYEVVLSDNFTLRSGAVPGSGDATWTLSSIQHSAMRVRYQVFGLLFRHTSWKAPSPFVHAAQFERKALL